MRKYLCSLTDDFCMLLLKNVLNHISSIQFQTVKCISFEVDFIRFPRINYFSSVVFFFSFMKMPDDGRESLKPREQMEFILTVETEKLNFQANSLDLCAKKKEKTNRHNMIYKHVHM